MNTKEAFKIGFLKECVDQGLPPEQQLERIRHAQFMLKSADLAGMAGNAFSSVWNAALPLALILPPLAGVGAGAVLAKSQDDAYGEGEIQKDEEISEYQRAIEKLKRLKARQAAEGF